MQHSLSSNAAVYELLHHVADLRPGSFHIDPGMKTTLSNHRGQAVQVFCSWIVRNVVEEVEAIKGIPY